MRRSPSLRYLGIEVGVLPRRMLGLPDGPLTDADIASALSRQRTRIDRHPAGGEPEADGLRRELESAAEVLRAEIRAGRTAPPPAVPDPRPVAAPFPVSEADLTEFDRLVLATLATEGGWNAASRARLVAIAARFGVSNDGLVRVLEGIRSAARSGALRRRPERVSGAVAELAAMRSADRRRSIPPAFAIDASTAVAARGDPVVNLAWMTVGFVAVTGLALWFLVSVLLSGSTPPPVARPSPPEVVDRARIESPPEVPVSPRIDPSRPPPVRWSRLPSMRGGLPPGESTADAAAAGALADRLGRISRRLELAPSRPAEVDLREWTDLVKAIGRCWPLLEPQVRTGLVETTVAVLRPLEDDRVADEFLAALSIDPRALARQPLGPWEGSFAAGILAECAARPSIAPAVSAAAADRLVPAVPRKVLSSDRGGTPAFEIGASAWLDRAARELVASTSGDAAAAARWERWLEAGRRLRGEAAVERSVLDAIDAALREPRLDPVRDGEGSDLLGRLVDEVDWTIRSPVRDDARERLRRWFADGEISSSRLWALTSLLDLDQDATWFVPELIVPPQADLAARELGIERILDAWPAPAATAPAGGGIPVEPGLLERWRAARDRVVESPAGDAFNRLRATVAASWLAAAGSAIAAGDVSTAEQLLGELDSTLSADAVGMARAGPTPGVASGIDGEFKAALEAAGRNPGKQQEQLRNLRMRINAGDLGPIDADTLVQRAFTTSDVEVRVLAQELIADRFADGITVLTEVLDQLPNPSRNTQEAEFLRKLTGSPLPDTRDPDWIRAARLALVRKIQRLGRTEGVAIDRLAARYAESIDVRARLFDAGYEPPAGSPSADEALGSLVRQWRGRAATMFLSDPFPAPLDELDRRREVRRTLADGPIRSCAAESLSLLELVAAVAVAEEPPVRARVAEILESVAERRARAGSALSQLLESELGISAVLETRFRPAIGAEEGES